MKKLFNYKNVAKVLAIALVLTILCAILPMMKIGKVFADTTYVTNYLDVSDVDLDSCTRRKADDEKMAAQITVFTPGVGGSASHWSNNGTDYTFAYDSESMIEQLRQDLGVDNTVVYVIKSAYEMDDYVLPKEKDYATSQIIDATFDNGATDLQAMYHKLEVRQEEWKKKELGINNLSEDELEKIYLSKSISLYKTEIATNGTVDYPIQEEINVLIGGVETTAITANDVSKHIILIFEPWGDRSDADVDKWKHLSESHDFVYAQLEYCLDAISYQYRQLTGFLPTYNLIAHSRGGITNMQYALAHPYNVASLYSMGTPYNGSAFGEFDPLLILGKQYNDYDYVDENGNEVNDFHPGVLDIMNFNLAESYKNFWNTYYNEHYSHIEFNPIGSYVTVGFALQTLADAIGDVLEEKNVSTEISEAVENVLRVIAGGVEIVSEIENIQDFIGEFGDLVLRTVWDAIENCLPKLDDVDDAPIIGYVLDFLEIAGNINIWNEPYEHLGTAIRGRYVYADDLFIDLDSQIAKGYIGADVRVKLMDTIDQMNTKKNVPAAGVAHNLEAHHQDIIDYVIENLTTGSSRPYDYRYADGGYHITNMNYAGCVEGVLTLPSTINGEPVIGIDRLTHHVTVNDNKTYHPEVTKVIIPASVKYISNYAFYGMRNLETVEFEAGSVLTKVDVGAFMDCTSLKNITLPDSTWIIGMKAFANCSSLQTFYIPKGTVTIGNMVFAGCKELTSFTVGSGNYTFAAEDGVLMNAEKTQLLYYPAKKGTSYVVPDSVTEIGPFAFAGGNTLTSINLNNVTMLRMGAFGKCTSLTNITANKLEIIEGGVVDDTAWKAVQTGDKILLGDVLLSYQGMETDLVLENINSIAPYAFAGNENLESVTLTRGIISIGAHAFDQCKNLENVYICNNADVVQVMDATFDGNAENRMIYVPYPFVYEYNSEFYGCDFNAHETVVTYDSKGGSACEEDTVYYQDYLTLPTPTKEGYTFIGWYMNEAYTGDLWSSNARWNILLDEVTLYAKWSSNSYNVVYNPEDSAISRADMGSESGDVEFGSPDYQFIVPTRRGYIFNGWFTERNGAGTQVSDAEGNGLIVWNYASDTAIYASWTVIEYTITYHLDGGVCQNPNPETYTIETETFALYNPVKESYNFKGWFDELTGEKSNNTMIYQGSIGDKEYTAKYNQLYWIMFDASNGSFCPAIQAEKNETILFPTSIRLGYTGKWDGIYEFGSTYTVTGETWFVAQWTGNTYTITFDNNGGTGGPTQATVQFEEAFPTIELPTKEGYCFDYYVTDDGGQYYMNGGTEDSLYCYDKDIRLTAHWTESFLAIENLGKSGTKWNIKITNNSSRTVTVEYNTKMCNASDAKNWTGLKNVQTFELAPNGASATVTISENWFATSITVSYKTSDGIRRITYANELTSSGGINVKMVKIT